MQKELNKKKHKGFCLWCCNMSPWNWKLVSDKAVGGGWVCRWVVYAMQQIVKGFWKGWAPKLCLWGKIEPDARCIAGEVLCVGFLFDWLVLFCFFMAEYIRKLYLTDIMQQESAKWSHALNLRRKDGNYAQVLGLSARGDCAGCSGDWGR